MKQLRYLLRHSLRMEFYNLERAISPALFAIVMMLVFQFAGMDQCQGESCIFLAKSQIFVAVYFALQMLFARVFDPEQKDGIFEVLRTYPVAMENFFLAKVLVLLLVGSLLTMFLFVAGSMFMTLPSGVDLFSAPMLLGAGLSLVGLSSLGTLLAVVLLQSHSRQVLYPILFFPLSTPVILGGQAIAQAESLEKIISGPQTPWLWLVIGFDVIYFGLGYVFYGELFRDQRQTTTDTTST